MNVNIVNLWNLRSGLSLFSIDMRPLFHSDELFCARCKSNYKTPKQAQYVFFSWIVIIQSETCDSAFSGVTTGRI